MARQESNIHYIYKTICLVTNRYYIGMHSTCNIDDGYMGSGKRLTASVRKHGVDNHNKEIIEFFDTRDLLIEAEKKAITSDMITDKDCMNLMGGGHGGYVSEEHYKKTSKIGAEKTNKLMWCEENKEQYSKLRSEQSKERWKQIDKDPVIRAKRLKGLDKTGTKHTDESKQLMCDVKKGKGIGSENSQYGTCWITKDGLNKKIKKEVLENYQQEGWIKGRTKL